jgi:hypothetical protein
MWLDATQIMSSRLRFLMLYKAAQIAYKERDRATVRQASAKRTLRKNPQTSE